MAFLDNSGLAYFWNKIKSEISSESCIVCSPNQPENLKKGLWIEIDSSDKDINILYDYENRMLDDSCTNVASTLALAVDATSACTIGEKAYIFGGYNNSQSSYSKAQSTIQCYDPNTDTITTKSAVLTNKMSETSACAIAEKAYIFGGAYEYNHNHLDTIQCYDPNTDVRTKSSVTLCNDMRSTSACAVNGKAYIFGGYCDGTYGGISGRCSYIQCYDPDTATITTKSAALSTTMYATSACTIGKKAYIFGGMSSSRSDCIQCYDPDTDTITTKSAVLSDAMYLTSACTIAEKAYIFGGMSSSRSNCIQCYDPDTDTITTKSKTMSKFLRASSACSVGSKAYIFGGNNGSETSAIQCYAPCCLEPYLKNSILIICCNSEVSIQAALAKFTFQNSIYNYEFIKKVYSVDSENNLTELPFHKIENYQPVFI